jgi:hypothetical protein
MDYLIIFSFPCPILQTDSSLGYKIHIFTFKPKHMNTTEKTMTTQEVANRLVELCRMGKMQEAQQELYGDDITSTEPAHAPMKSAKGKADVAKKGAEFAAMIETRHGGSFSDAVVGGRYFSCSMTLDATFKGKGRMTIEEICVFEVKDGKIVSEQFFF